MNIINAVRKGLQNLPFINKPQFTTLNTFQSQYSWGLQRANKPAGDFDIFYRAENNVFVDRCIQVYEDTLLSAGYSINNPNKEYNDTPRINYLEKLFNNPEGINNESTFETFHSRYVRSFLLTGDAFIAVSYDEAFNNIINGFQFIPPELMFFDTETDQWGFRNTEIRFENDELIHIYKPSIRLKGSKWGVNQIEKVALLIGLQFSSMKQNKELIEDTGLDPNNVLSFDSEIPVNDFYAEIERLNALKNKKGTLAVKGATLIKGRDSNRDMEMYNLMLLSRDWIITAFGVQPAKVGVRETANLGSGSGISQDKDFKDIVKGRCKLIEGPFNKVLGRNGFSELFQYNDLDIEDKLQRINIEDKQIRNGTVSINEVRASYGLDPVDWGNVPLNYTQFGISSSTENISINGVTPLNEIERLKKALLYERLNKEYK